MVSVLTKLENLEYNETLYIEKKATNDKTKVAVKTIAINSTKVSHQVQFNYNEPNSLSNVILA